MGWRTRKRTKIFDEAEKSAWILAPNDVETTSVSPSAAKPPRTAAKRNPANAQDAAASTLREETAAGALRGARLLESDSARIGREKPRSRTSVACHAVTDRAASRNSVFTRCAPSQSPRARDSFEPTRRRSTNAAPIAHSMPVESSPSSPPPPTPHPPG